MSLRECRIKFLRTSKKKTKTPQSPLLAKATSHTWDFQPAWSPYTTEFLKVFSQGGEVLIWCWWHILDGRKAEATPKVFWSTSQYLNYNFHCFSEISVRYLFKGRSSFICTLEALTQARSLLKLLSENMQGHLLKSSYIASIFKQPLLHSDPLPTTWAATASAGHCHTLITHAERGTAWLMPSTACLGMVMQLNSSLLSVLFQ